MISYTKCYDKDKNRVEYLLRNYDYFDGNDLLADIFCREFNFVIVDKFDGFWFKTITLCLEKCNYVFLWHEDVGNLIYCMDQMGNSNEILETRLKRAILILNDMFK